jgi:uncharacterized protein (TIGR00703 family)
MILELRREMALNTLVFETLGQPEKEREFKLKQLKKWGFDLIFGRKNGEETYFASADRKVGDKYTEDENQFEVVEILKELPKNKKVFAHIEMIEGRAYLCVDLREGEENLEILRIPAGEVLLAFLKKHKLIQTIEALRNIGTAAVLLKKKGDEGKPYPYEELPPVFRRFLRDAKKVEKEMGFGRIALAYFGENKEGIERYWAEWMVPTIALFDEKIAQKVDKNLAGLPK